MKAIPGCGEHQGVQRTQGSIGSRERRQGRPAAEAHRQAVGRRGRPRRRLAGDTFCALSLTTSRSPRPRSGG